MATIGGKRMWFVRQSIMTKPGVGAIRILKRPWARNKYLRAEYIHPEGQMYEIPEDRVEAVLAARDIKDALAIVWGAEFEPPDEDTPTIVF